MPSIDERVVSMAFENTVFEQRVATTMTTLSKLNDAIAKTGTGPNGLENIEKSANKVTLEAPMSALDKLKAKLGMGVDAKPIQDIEKAGQNVTLAQPVKAVDNLQNKLDKGIDPRAIQDLEKAGSGVTFDGPSRAIDALQGKFSALTVAAGVAFGNIATQAAMKGANWAKSFGVGPILDGLHEYQTNLQAIQTVQANTDQPLSKINKSLQELNTYSDQTIYNFGEMAKNIGTFTAAGVDLKTATSSIKGIANMAALSGSTSQQAATAMYQLSQAISSGRVGLQDWNSVVNAGMGGKKLQNALAQTSIAMGGLKGETVKMEGPMKKLTIHGESFRESIMSKPGTKPWLTSEVLVNTLATLDGRFSKAALGAELTKNGLKKYTAAQIESKIATSRAALEAKNHVKYTDEQFKALMHLSDSAFKSATEVKTLGQVFDVAKETIGSGWSASFQNIFGNLGEAKKLFTGMSNTINGFINRIALARNTVLASWKELGGRADVIQGLKNIFNVLFDVLGKVGKAFREIFPKKTGQDLADMSRSFLIFTAHLNNSPQVIDNIARTFKGLFAVLHIGWSIIAGVGKVLFDLLGIVGKGSGGFLNFTGGIGDFLVALDTALTKGGLLTSFFKGLTGILRAPIDIIRSLASSLASIFGGVDDSKSKTFRDALDKTSLALSPMEKLVIRVRNAWASLSDVFQKIGTFLSPIFEKVKGVFSTIGDAIAEGLKNADMEKVLAVFQTTLLGGIFLTLKKALGGGKGGFDLSGGVLGQLKEVLSGVTGQLTAMQKNVQAGTLLKIGAAIAVLAAGVFVLSTIEPKKLASAMTAIAVGLGEMGAALKIMSSGGLAGGAQMAAVATGMLLIATATVILAAAMKIFSTMSWEELAKGLAGVAGAIAGIGLAMKTVGPARIIPIAAGLTLIGVALILIATATKIFAELKWEQLAKGLLGMAGALAVVAAGVALMGPELIIVGPGLIAAAFGMTILAGAVTAFGAIDPKRMLSGILGLGLALSALGLALGLMPPTALLTGAGLVVAATAITILAAAVAAFGKLKIETLLKGLIGMGAAMVELAIGLTLMAGTIPGAIALMGAAVAFAVLGPALAFMGVLPWSVILKGLAAMALSMGTIAIVGIIAAPALLAMGGALVVLGLGLTMIGAAIYLAAKGLSLLGENGAKGIGVLVSAITAFVALLPTLVINFVKGLVSIIEEVAKVAPKVVVALGVILDTVIAFVAEHAVKFGQAVGLLIDAILEVIVTRSPAIIAAGLGLLVNLLSGISNNIGTVVTKVGEIITKFLNALATQAPRIVAAGAKAIVSYLGGIATALPQIVAAGAKIVNKFLDGITAQLPRVIAKGAKLIVTFLNSLSAHIGEVQAAGINLLVKYIDGIGDGIPRIIAAGARVVKKFLNGIAETIPELVDAGFKAIIKFLHGIEQAIRQNDTQLIDAGARILDAIIDGVVQAAGRLGGPLKSAIEKLFGLLPGWAKKVLGIHSPSSVFAEIGKNTLLGLKQGIDDNHAPVMQSAGNIGQGLIDQFRDVFQIQSPSKVLKEIGKEVGHGFRDGLDGSVEDIRNAFTNMKDKIRQELETQRNSVKEENTKLEDLQKQHADKLDEIAKLRKAKKPDKEAIKTAVDEAKDLEKQINVSEKALGKYRAVVAALSGANTALTKGLQVEKAQLLGLSKDYETVSKVLDMATQALDAATQKRDDAIKSYTDQFSTLPDWDSLLSNAMAEADMTYDELAEARRKKQEEANKKAKIDQVALYKQALQEQIVATKQYQETLAKLRELGLDDATYKKLLEKGLAGQDFASQLLASGKAGVEQINKMDAELAKTAAGLATQVSKSLYQAGIDAAQGLVNGLKAKRAELAAAMDVLATSIVASIKSKLGIRSPSKVFGEVGKNAAEGLAQGLTDSSKSVADAAVGVGDDAAKALTNSLSNISDRVGAEIDTDVTITPVLDLSQVHKEAKNMPQFAGSTVTPITAAPSFNAASAISSHAASVASKSTAGVASYSPVVNFTQNNNSPKALSDIEIYRRTNNQLGNLKRSLGVGG